jgi:LDH2 family malate/lactate/ureidoglycolate dehydrogenase
VSTTSAAVTHVPFAELEGLLRTSLARHSVSEPNAGIIATNCASCERDGAVSHGVFRIPGYVTSIASGWLDESVAPSVERHGPSPRSPGGPVPLGTVVEAELHGIPMADDRLALLRELTGGAQPARNASGRRPVAAASAMMS